MCFDQINVIYNINIYFVKYIWFIHQNFDYHYRQNVERSDFFTIDKSKSAFAIVSIFMLQSIIRYCEILK